MSDDRQFERTARAWLELGPTDVPERVVENALLSIESTPQERDLLTRLPWRFPSMNPTSRRLAAAVLGVIAVGSALYVLRPDQSAIGGPTGSPVRPSPSRSANPTAPASPLAASGTWTLTGRTLAAHSFHTATLLSDGRVLVVGGCNGAPAPEVYEPGRGSWTMTGGLTDSCGKTATLLLDGRVLVAGGAGSETSDGGPVASAELYDPSSGTWTASADMRSPRAGLTATLLLDGRVLVAGGFSQYGTGTGVQSSAELFDPRTGSWTLTGQMTEGRAGHTATLLSDGRVLVVGGEDRANVSLASTEFYDPRTGSWTAGGTMNEARWGNSATLLSDGRVLVAGGNSSSFVALATAELYDPRNGSWTATGAMQVPRQNQAASLLPNGTVLVAGGNGGSGVGVASAELYDPGTGSWSSAGTMSEPRTGLTATRLLDGRVLVVGGSFVGTPSAVAELYAEGSP